MCLLSHTVWKLLKMSHLNFGIFHQFSTNFCPILKLTYLVTLIDHKLQFLPKLKFFWHYQWTFVNNLWMRLFLWFSNTVLSTFDSPPIYLKDPWSLESWANNVIILGGDYALGKCETQHGHGFQAGPLAENTFLQRILLQFWRLQLGLVTATSE